jgi:hypothetical protein
MQNRINQLQDIAYFQVLTKRVEEYQLAIRNISKQIKLKNMSNTHLGDNVMRHKEEYENNTKFLTEKNLFFDNIELKDQLKKSMKKMEEKIEDLEERLAF